MPPLWTPGSRRSASGLAGRRLPRHPDHARAVGGFTIVEVIVATVVLTTGLIAMAGSTLLVVRQITMSELASKRTAAQQSALERIGAMAYDQLGTGTDSVPGFVMTWSSVPVGPQSKLITVVTRGPGMSKSANRGFPMLVDGVADTITYRRVKP